MSRWTNIETLLSRPSKFGNETGQLANGYYEPHNYIQLMQRLQPGRIQGNIPTDTGAETDNESSAGAVIEHIKLLVIGAGGLGCEILKDLALSGITDIHVIGDQQNCDNSCK